MIWANYFKPTVKTLLVNKLVILSVVVAAVVIAGATAYYSNSENVIPVVERMHGDVSTAMGSPVLGDPMAPVTIVEFGDYQCHQCYNWFHETKPLITREFIDSGKANLIFVDLAFLGRDSLTAAQATYCAEDQGMYWEYHDILYTSQESQIDNGWANSERLKAFAFTMGLDMDLFDSCLDSKKYEKRVQLNIAQAQKAGATGTPAFVIVGPGDKQEMISGAQPYSVFKLVIDSMV